MSRGANRTRVIGRARLMRRASIIWIARKSERNVRVVKRRVNGRIGVTHGRGGNARLGNGRRGEKRSVETRITIAGPERIERLTTYLRELRRNTFDFSSGGGTL